MGVEIIIRIPDEDKVPKKLKNKIEKAGYDIIQEDIQDRFRVRITASALFIRSEPTTASNKIGKILENEICTIKDVIGNWYELLCGGYIYSKYTERID